MICHDPRAASCIIGFLLKPVLSGSSGTDFSVIMSLDGELRYMSMIIYLAKCSLEKVYWATAAHPFVYSDPPSRTKTALHGIFGHPS